MNENRHEESECFGGGSMLKSKKQVLYSPNLSLVELSLCNRVQRAAHFSLLPFASLFHHRLLSPSLVREAPHENGEIIIRKLHTERGFLL